MLKVSLSHSCLSALIGTQTARALFLLEKEGVHLIHGQSATGYDTLLHLGEVGLVEQTASRSAARYRQRSALVIKNLTTLTFLQHGIVSELPLLMPQSKS